MTLTTRWWAFWTAILAAPMIAFVVLLRVPQWDRNFGSFDFHFWAVSVTTLAAAAAYVLVIGLTRSLRETRLVFLGLAFLSVAAIFLVHGLGTPGHIHAQAHAELRVSSWLSVVAGAFFVACSVITLPEHADQWFKRHGGLVFSTVSVALGLYIGLSIASPDWLAWIPIRDRDLQLGMTAVTMTLLGFAAWRYFQAFLFARLSSQWAMEVALVLLLEVQTSLTWGWYWHFSWWGYHGLYGLAFLVLFGGWAVEAIRAGNLRVIAEALTMRDAISQLSRGYDKPITELVDAIELKDLYTLGHVRRVAGYALIIGRELGLPTLQLRNLALAAQMHDVGKIGVPDRILTKPGPLTTEEFAIIKEHANRGYEIAGRVPALRPVANAIRYHHERIDGTGYPLGLDGDQIPLEARIVSVADAFDAMTSGRVYQAAVSREAALEELKRCAGSHFDSVCVEAFLAGLTKLPPAEVLRDLEARALEMRPAGEAA